MMKQRLILLTLVMIVAVLGTCTAAETDTELTIELEEPAVSLEALKIDGPIEVDLGDAVPEADGLIIDALEMEDQLLAEGDVESVFDIGEEQTNGSAPEDFNIVDGVLVGYVGAGGDVVIPNDVTAIGASVFYNNDSITSVVIPEGVTRIEDCAFYDCVNMTSAVIPQSVTSIGSDAFGDCELSSVTFGNNLTSIGRGAFSHNPLTTITIPGSVTFIGESAFGGCKLESVVLSEGVQEIWQDAFRDLQIISVSLPSTLKTIQTRAFYQCQYLREINFPDGLTMIGDFAFWKCSGLREITLPESIRTIGLQAFELCGNLKKVSLPEGLETIAPYAFQRCGKLESIAIPDSVTSLGDYAFCECGSLLSAKLPGKMKNLPKYLLRECGSLKSVTIPNGVESIGEGLLYKCGAIEHVDIPDSVEIINSSAFSYCSSLKKINLPDSVKYIGGAAFAGSGLSEFTFPKQVSALERYTFSECYFLESIRIPGRVGTISAFAFDHCQNLKDVVIEEGVKRIEACAFGSCVNLTHITLPNSVYFIALDAIGINEYFDEYTHERVKETNERLYIHGKDGSYAQEFAENYGIRFIIDAESVAIAQGSSATVELGSELQLEAKLEPTNSNDLLTWDSSEPTVAVVNVNGAVTPISLGEAVISVHTYGGKSASISVRVMAPEPASVTLNETGTVSLEQGQTLQLIATVSPENAQTTLTWTSDDSEVATVSESGLVTAIGEGIATVTVKTGNDLSALVEIKVLPPHPTSVKITQGSSATLYMGNKLTLKAKVSPTNAKTTLTWKSSKPKIAAVSSKGVVTPKAAGNAVITVKTGNGKSAKITVNVVDAKSVKLKEGESKTLKVGKKLTLHAIVSPSKVKTKLTWSSSNKKVATVSSKGVVKAVKAGTAKITVKTSNGKKAIIKINVK